MCVCVFVCLLLFFFLLLLVNMVKWNWGGRGRGAFLLFQPSFVLLSEMGVLWEPQIGIAYSYNILSM
jgi:hypothetical protein